MINFESSVYQLQRQMSSHSSLPKAGVSINRIQHHNRSPAMVSPSHANCTRPGQSNSKVEAGRIAYQFVSTPSQNRTQCCSQAQNMYPPLNKKHTEMINGLRSELLTIKSQVSKLITESNQKKGQQEINAEGVTNFDEFRQEVDKRSQDLLQKMRSNGNLRGLQIQNDSLKNQLKNLRKRYIEKKEAHKQEVDILNQKVEVLQLTLKQNESRLYEYKKDIEEEVKQIRSHLQGSAQIKTEMEMWKAYAESYMGKIKVLEEELMETKQIYSQKLISAKPQSVEQSVQSTPTKTPQRSVEYAQIEVQTVEPEAKQTPVEVQIQTERQEEQEQEQKQKIKFCEVKNQQVNTEQEQSIQEDTLKVQQCEETICKLEGELNKLRTQFQFKLTATTNQHSKALQRLQAIQEQAIVLSRQSQAEVKQLRDTHAKEIETFREKSVALSEEVSRLATTIASKNTEIANLTAKIIQTQQHEVSSREAEITNSILEGYRVQVTDLNQKIKSQQDTIKEMKQQRDITTNKMNEAAEKAKQSDTKCTVLEKQNTELKAKLAQIAQMPVNTQLSEEVSELIRSLQCRNSLIETQILRKDEQINILNRNLVMMEQQCYDSKIKTKQQSQQMEIMKQTWADRFERQLLIRNQLQNKLERAELSYLERVDDLLKQIRSLSSEDKPMSEGFDSVLKDQIQQNMELKQQLASKCQEIHQLKDHIACNRSQVDHIRAEIEIQKLRAIAQRKNIQVAAEIESQRLKNQLEAQRKASECVNSKFKVAMDEVKNKDTFIQKFIMGKKWTPEQRPKLQDFFKLYEAAFPLEGFRQNLAEQVKTIYKLQSANVCLIEQIQLLKKTKAVSASTLVCSETEILVTKDQAVLETNDTSVSYEQ